MSPKSEDIAELEKWRAAKEAECEAHQERTDRIGETMHHPECGLVVKMAKMETQLGTLTALAYSTLASTVLVLIALVGYFYHENSQKQNERRTSETVIIPSSVATLR